MNAPKEFDYRTDPTWSSLVRAGRENLGGPVLFTYQSSHDPWLTNSYYFETERGVVLFDTQTFRSSAEELWEDINRHTSGALYAIVNTHAHPDHVSGNEFFRRVAPTAFIATAEGVAAELRHTAHLRTATQHSEFGDEVPAKLGPGFYPDVVFRGSLSLRFEQITLELTEHGPSEARAHVTGSIPEHTALITGDLVQNRQHYFMGEMQFQHWYTQIDRMQSLDPTELLTGHQGVTGPEMLVETKRWIATFLGLMAAHVGAGNDPQDVRGLDDAGRQAVIEGMASAFPEWHDEIMTADGETAMQYCLRGRDSATEHAASAARADV